MSKVHSMNPKMSMFLSKPLTNPTSLSHMRPPSLSGEGRYYWNSQQYDDEYHEKKHHQKMNNKRLPQRRTRRLTLSPSLPRRNRLYRKYRFRPAMKFFHSPLTNTSRQFE